MTQRETQARTLEIKERQLYLSLRGLKACTRCSGQGGLAAWPGYTCYDCKGAGTLYDRVGEARSAQDIVAIEMVGRAKKALLANRGYDWAIADRYAAGDDAAAQYLFDQLLDLNCQ